MINGDKLTRRTALIGSACAAALPFSTIAQVRTRNPGTGRYVGKLITEWSADGTYMKLTADYCYIDEWARRWIAPAGATINGASIPRFLWGLVGSPFTGKYRNASVIHDWYCAVRTQPWKDVHRMFYDAMITSGVSKFEALRMYYAVRIAGPSWDDLTISNNRLISGGGRTRVVALNELPSALPPALEDPGTYSVSAPGAPAGSSDGEIPAPSAGIVDDPASRARWANETALYAARVSARAQMEAFGYSDAVFQRETLRNVNATAALLQDREVSLDVLDQRADVSRTSIALASAKRENETLDASIPPPPVPPIG